MRCTRSDFASTPSAPEPVLRSRGVPGGQRPPDERLFVAIVPPPPVVDHLAAAVAHLADPALRWQPPERWHVTLAFLGDASPAPVRGHLHEAVAGLSPIQCRLAGSGTFRPGGDGGVLWVGVTGTGLAALAGRVRTALLGDTADYRPHVTLARWRGHPQAARSVAAALREYAGPPWPVSSIELISSHLGPVPRYETVERRPLPGSAFR